VFLDHNTTGDGMLTALQVLAILRREERPLSELARVMSRAPQVLKSVRVREKRPFDQIPDFGRALAKVEAELAGRGRTNVRYSGTEALARIMLEGDDLARLESLAEELCAVLRKAIGEGAK
jgi:phosphoglucosamine mutase